MGLHRRNSLIQPSSAKIMIGLMIMFMAISMVSALEFDNIVKDIDTSSNIFIGDKEISYNTIWEKYNPIQIDNIFGLGETLWEGAIDEHTESCGINCYSTITISLPKDGSLIDDVKFLTEQEDESWIEQPIRSYDFYILDNEIETKVQDYETQCLEKTVEIGRASCRERV